MLGLLLALQFELRVSGGSCCGLLDLLLGLRSLLGAYLDRAAPLDLYGPSLTPCG